jgi:hypothetical protein
LDLTLAIFDQISRSVERLLNIVQLPIPCGPLLEPALFPVIIHGRSPPSSGCCEMRVIKLSVRVSKPSWAAQGHGARGLRYMGKLGVSLMHKSLAEMLEERVACIEEALTQIEQQGEAPIGLHNLQAHLPNLLELIERKAGITAAADDLLSAATAFMTGDHPARTRLLREAFQRFRDRLKSARPSERGRMMGLK